MWRRFPASWPMFRARRTRRRSAAYWGWRTRSAWRRRRTAYAPAWSVRGWWIPDLTRGLVFSGQVLLDLAAGGMQREQAYRLVQEHAMRAWEEEGDFRSAIESDAAIQAVLSAEKIAESFSLERQLRNVDKIFARVFGKVA